MIRKFKTNLRCEACVNSIRPVLDAAAGIKSWRADVSVPDKLLTLEGEDILRERVAELLAQAGYRVLDELPTEPPATPTHHEPPEEKTSYFPLALIVAYILGVVALVEVTAGEFDATRAMMNFMAGFFLVFSFFKLLNVSAFADSYQMYDLIAARSRPYALAYPFIELALGVAYLLRIEPTATNAVTLVIMLIGTAGVLRTILARRKVKCACLGAVFNLPMSYVTLAEDGLMALMAAGMLVMG